mgnify:CR=1 FL=1
MKQTKEKLVHMIGTVVFEDLGFIIKPFNEIFPLKQTQVFNANQVCKDFLLYLYNKDNKEMREELNLTDEKPSVLTVISCDEIGFLCGYPLYKVVGIGDGVRVEASVLVEKYW